MEDANIVRDTKMQGGVYRARGKMASSFETTDSRRGSGGVGKFKQKEYKPEPKSASVGKR